MMESFVLFALRTDSVSSGWTLILVGRAERGRPSGTEGVGGITFTT